MKQVSYIRQKNLFFLYYLMGCVLFPVLRDDVLAIRNRVFNETALTGLEGRTAAQAIEEGVEPRDVWRALCVDFDVPRDQW